MKEIKEKRLRIGFKGSNKVKKKLDIKVLFFKFSIFDF